MTYTLNELPPTRTAKDYYRLDFDPSNLPKKRIVGLLACQRDPLLRTLKSTVLSASPAPITAPPAQKGKNKARRAATDANGLGITGGGGGGGESAGAGEGKKGALWEVVTEDSVIFPEGGGQPTDTGVLHLLDPNGSRTGKCFVVEGCLRKGLEAVHLVRVSEGEALDSIVGKEVEFEVDWDRRADHMAIHTSQHLLSAILDTLSLPTLSWSIAQYPSIEPPYIELPRQMTWKEVDEVEERCNQLVKEARSVWVEASLQGDEGGVKDGEGDRASRGIPKDYAGGVIRHINIEGVDRNACCGTHVPDLSHCGTIHLLPPSLAPDSTSPSQSQTRLYFTAGPRCIRYLRQSSRQLSTAATVLLINRDDVPKRVEQIDMQRKEAVDREKGVRAELAVMLGQAACRAVEVEKGIVWMNRSERATHDFEFSQAIGSAFIAAAQSQAEQRQGEGSRIQQPIIVVTSALPGPGQTALMLVQSLDQEGAKMVNEKLKTALDELAPVEGEAKGKRVKGGGAKGRYMCKVDGKWGKREDERVKQVLEECRLGRSS